MDKIWKDIPGYNGKASSDGELLSTLTNNLVGFKVEKTDKYVAEYAVLKNKNGVMERKGKHYFIALAFPEICGEYFDGAEIDHRDTNPLNNSPFNLHWVDKKTNMANPLTKTHQKESALKRDNSYLKGRVLSKLWHKVSQYNSEGNLIKEWDSVAIAAKELRIPAPNISRSKNNEFGKYSAGGYLWH